VGAVPPRGLLFFGEAQDPDDPDRTVLLRLEVSTLNRWARKDFKKGCGLKTAREVVRFPERIFWGVHRFDDREKTGRCYSGRPARISSGPGTSYPLPPGRVVVVLVDSLFTVFDWEQRAADRGDAASPEHWQTEIGGLKWTRPQTR